MWDDDIEPKNQGQAQETALGQEQVNAPITNHYMTNNISLLSNLTWRELEIIYCLHIPSLRNYIKNSPDNSKINYGQDSVELPELHQSLVTESTSQIESIDPELIPTIDPQPVSENNFNQTAQEFSTAAQIPETISPPDFTDLLPFQTIDPQPISENNFNQTAQEFSTAAQIPETISPPDFTDLLPFQTIDPQPISENNFNQTAQEFSTAAQIPETISPPDFTDLLPFQTIDPQPISENNFNQTAQEFFSLAKPAENTHENKAASGHPVQEIDVQLRTERKSSEIKPRQEFSNSPFAKLKSNALKTNQLMRDISSGQDSGQKQSDPDQVESAWFVEPEAKSDPDSMQDSVPEDQPTAQYEQTEQITADPPVVPIESVPVSSPAESLDEAIDTAFDIMLGPVSAKFKTELSSVKKSGSPSPLSSPPLIKPGPTGSIGATELFLQSAPPETPKQADDYLPQKMEVADKDDSWMPVQPNKQIPAEPIEPKVPLATFDFSLADAGTRNQPPSHSSTSKDNSKLGPADDENETADDLISITVSDELRNLIQNHIKHAADQIADATAGQSIGTGQEFEVWLNNPARSKFVGAAKPPELPPTTNNSTTFKPRIVPPEIRKSCLILGLRPEEISYETVQDVWKKAIALPGVHPDQGGDTELAVYLNTAKDTLMHWLDVQAPKLGKKFGPQKREPLGPKEKGKEQK